MNLVDNLACLPTSESFGYYVTEDDYVVASNDDGIFVMAIEGLSGYGAHVSALTLQDGKFVERRGHHEIWFAQGQSLFRLDYHSGVLAPMALPFLVDDMNIFPSQDQLAIVTSSSVFFLSLVTGSAQQVALP